MLERRVVEGHLLDLLGRLYLLLGCHSRNVDAARGQRSLGIDHGVVEGHLLDLLGGLEFLLGCHSRNIDPGGSQHLLRVDHGAVILSLGGGLDGGNLRLNLRVSHLGGVDTLAFQQRRGLGDVILPLPFQRRGHLGLALLQGHGAAGFVVAGGHVQPQAGLLLGNPVQAGLLYAGVVGCLGALKGVGGFRFPLPLVELGGGDAETLGVGHVLAVGQGDVALGVSDHGLTFQLGAPHGLGHTRGDQGVRGHAGQRVRRRAGGGFG